MTDEPATDRHDPGADPLDELATAIVDGTATADEQAQGDEAALAERVAVHRRVAARLADPPSPSSDGRRDQAIAAAVAAADHEPDEGAPVGPVTTMPVRPVPARVTGGSSRRWLTAAAVVAAVAVAIPVLSNIDGAGTDDEQSATAADADDESTGAADSEAASPLAEENGGAAGATEEAVEGGEAQSADSAPTTTVVAAAPATVGDLGAFAELETLLAAATTTLRAGGATTGTTAVVGGTGGSPTAQVDRCVRRLADDEPDAAVGGRATALLADRPVVVLLVDDATGPRLVVLAADDCQVLADRAI
jgi:hypothetical protein